MGQMAEDMINGYSCSLCGVYFEEENGYPVVCSTCYSELTDEEKKGYELAWYEEA